MRQKTHNSMDRLGKKTEGEMEIDDLLDDEGWDLLNSLTEEELAELNADFDPENALIPVQDRSDYAMAKNSKPMFNKEDLVEGLERMVENSRTIIQNDKIRAKEEKKKAENEAILKRKYSRDKPKFEEPKQIALTAEEEDLLNEATEEELIEAAEFALSRQQHEVRDRLLVAISIRQERRKKLETFVNEDITAEKPDKQDGENDTDISIETEKPSSSDSKTLISLTTVKTSSFVVDKQSELATQTDVEKQGTSTNKNDYAHNNLEEVFKPMSNSSFDFDSFPDKDNSNNTDNGFYVITDSEIDMNTNSTRQKQNSHNTSKIAQTRNSTLKKDTPSRECKSKTGEESQIKKRENSRPPSPKIKDNNSKLKSSRSPSPKIEDNSKTDLASKKSIGSIRPPSPKTTTTTTTKNDLKKCTKTIPQQKSNSHSLNKTSQQKSTQPLIKENSVRESNHPTKKQSAVKSTLQSIKTLPNKLSLLKSNKGNSQDKQQNHKLSTNASKLPQQKRAPSPSDKVNTKKESDTNSTRKDSTSRKTESSNAILKTIVKDQIEDPASTKKLTNTNEKTSSQVHDNSSETSTHLSQQNNKNNDNTKDQQSLSQNLEKVNGTNGELMQYDYTEDNENNKSKNGNPDEKLKSYESSKKVQKLKSLAPDRKNSKKRSSKIPKEYSIDRVRRYNENVKKYNDKVVEENRKIVDGNDIIKTATPRSGIGTSSETESNKKKQNEISQSKNSSGEDTAKCSSQNVETLEQPSETSVNATRNNTKRDMKQEDFETDSLEKSTTSSKNTAKRSKKSSLEPQNSYEVMESQLDEDEHEMVNKMIDEIARRRAKRMSKSKDFERPVEVRDVALSPIIPHEFMQAEIDMNMLSNSRIDNARQNYDPLFDTSRPIDRINALETPTNFQEQRSLETPIYDVRSRVGCASSSSSRFYYDSGIEYTPSELEVSRTALDYNLDSSTTPTQSEIDEENPLSPPVKYRQKQIDRKHDHRNSRDLSKIKRHSQDMAKRKSGSFTSRSIDRAENETKRRSGSHLRHKRSSSKVKSIDLEEEFLYRDRSATIDKSLKRKRSIKRNDSTNLERKGSFKSQQSMERENTQNFKSHKAKFLEDLNIAKKKALAQMLKDNRVNLNLAKMNVDQNQLREVKKGLAQLIQEEIKPSKHRDKYADKHNDYKYDYEDSRMYTRSRWNRDSKGSEEKQRKPSKQIERDSFEDEIEEKPYKKTETTDKRNNTSITQSATERIFDQQDKFERNSKTTDSSNLPDEDKKTTTNDNKRKVMMTKSDSNIANKANIFGGKSLKPVENAVNKWRQYDLSKNNQLKRTTELSTVKLRQNESSKTTTMLVESKQQKETSHSLKPVMSSTDSQGNKPNETDPLKTPKLVFNFNDNNDTLSVRRQTKKDQVDGDFYKEKVSISQQIDLFNLQKQKEKAAKETEIEESVGRNTLVIDEEKIKLVQATQKPPVTDSTTKNLQENKPKTDVLKNVELNASKVSLDKKDSLKPPDSQPTQNKDPPSPFGPRKTFRKPKEIESLNPSVTTTSPETNDLSHKAQMENMRFKLRKIEKVSENNAKQSPTTFLLPENERKPKKPKQSGGGGLAALLAKDEQEKESMKFREKPKKEGSEQKEDIRGISAASLQKALLKMNGILTNDQIESVWAGDKPKGSLKNNMVKSAAVKGDRRISQKDEETELDVVELMKNIKEDSDALFYLCINNQPKLEKKVKGSLIKAVETSKKVRHVSFAMIGLIDHEIKQLAEALRFNDKIETLNLESNVITQHGLTPLMKAITRHPSIREVKIANQKQPFGAQGEECMATAIDNNENILKFGYSFQHAGPRNKADRAIIRHNEKLRQKRKNGEEVYDLKAVCKIRDPSSQPWIKVKNRRGLGGLIESKASEIGNRLDESTNGRESRESGPTSDKSKPFSINDLLSQRKEKLRGTKIEELEMEQERKRKQQLKDMQESENPKTDENNNDAAMNGPKKDDVGSEINGDASPKVDASSDGDQEREGKETRKERGSGQKVAQLVRSDDKIVRRKRDKLYDDEEKETKEDQSEDEEDQEISENTIAERDGDQTSRRNHREKSEVSKDVARLPSQDKVVRRRRNRYYDDDEEDHEDPIEAALKAQKEKEERQKKEQEEETKRKEEEEEEERKAKEEKANREKEESRKQKLSKEGGQKIVADLSDSDTMPRRRRRRYEFDDEDEEEERRKIELKRKQKEDEVRKRKEEEEKLRKEEEEEERQREIEEEKARKRRAKEEEEAKKRKAEEDEKKRKQEEEEKRKREEKKKNKEPVIDIFGGDDDDDQPKKMSLRERMARRGR